MLKIKDNVDLKELEKFGFRFINLGDNFYTLRQILCFHNDDLTKSKKIKSKHSLSGEIIIANDDVIYIRIVIEYFKINKLRYIFTNNTDYYIQDLIQAGLVEKVEE